MAIHTANEGFIIQIDLQEDISLATVKNLVFKSPDGDIFTVTGTFATDGTDGLLNYTVQPGQVDIDGVWRVQPYIEMSSFEGFGDVVEFTVLQTLAASP